MTQTFLTGIAIILCAGTIGQIMAWRLRLPSILILLGLGTILGQLGLGWLDPDNFLGSNLFPVVSISVAVILFEGGLSLRFPELPGVRAVIFSLISIGMLVTWAISTLAAKYFLEMNTSLALMLGAILTISGPTVVIPLLRHIRPKAPLGEILKWEGILIDPVGALATVFVFEAILAGEFAHAPFFIVKGIIATLIFGGSIGIISGVFLAQAVRRHLVPEFLFNSFTLMLVICCYVLSNYFHEESGLLAVVLAGLVVANSKGVELKKIIEFKEHLVLILISSLFIMLAARISFEELARVNWFNTVIFLALLLLVARPCSVFISTLGSSLNWKQRVFLAWMAPRGIVAAAVSSLFALELQQKGVPNSDILIPYVFLTITGTVIVYSLTSLPLARLLNLAQKSPQGILFVGASDLSRNIAELLYLEGFPVLLVDTNQRNINLAKLSGLPAYHGNIFSGGIIDQLDLNGIGCLMAMTPNYEANSLAVVVFREIFGSNKVYQLPEPSFSKNTEKELDPESIHGRFLFSKLANYYDLDDSIHAGAMIKATPFTEEFDLDSFKKIYGDNFIPMFIVTSEEKLIIITIDSDLNPEPGEKLISLVYE